MLFSYTDVVEGAEGSCGEWFFIMHSLTCPNQVEESKILHQPKFSSFLCLLIWDVALFIRMAFGDSHAVLEEHEVWHFMRIGCAGAKNDVFWKLKKLVLSGREVHLGGAMEENTNMAL